jgi:hypothetical protein
MPVINKLKFRVKSSYSQRVISLLGSSIVAYWVGDERSGVIMYDHSGNNRNGAISNVNLGAIQGMDGKFAGLWNGSNSVVNVFSTGLQTAFNDQEGSLFMWTKMASASVWTDGTIRRFARLSVNVNNLVDIRKDSGSNSVTCLYVAGATSKSVALTGQSWTGWGSLCLTWSKSADEVKFYVRGVQAGTTQTGLGVWAGVLSSVGCAFGAVDLTPSQPFSGYLAHGLVVNRPLTSVEVARLSSPLS